MFCASFDVFYVFFLCGQKHIGDDRLQEISGEGVGGPPYMPPAYFTRQGFSSTKKDRLFAFATQEKLTKNDTARTKGSQIVS